MSAVVQDPPVMVGNTAGNGIGTPLFLKTDSNGQPYAILTDGTTVPTVKGASTQAAATDPALVTRPMMPTDGTNPAKVAATAVIAGQSGVGAQLVTRPGEWSVTHAPAAATQATIAKAAGAAGVKHVVTGISAGIACGDTAQTPIGVAITEETTGTVLWNGVLSAPANSSASIELTGLNLIQSTAAKGLTIAFSGAGVSNSKQVVNMSGYDIS